MIKQSIFKDTKDGNTKSLSSGIPYYKLIFACSSLIMLFRKQPITTLHPNRKHRRKTDTAECKDLNRKKRC